MEIPFSQPYYRTLVLLHLAPDLARLHEQSRMLAVEHRGPGCRLMNGTKVVTTMRVSRSCAAESVRAIR